MTRPIYGHIGYDWASLAGKHSVPRPLEQPTESTPTLTPDEQIVTLRARVARLEQQLDDSLKSLGEKSLQLRRASQFILLQESAARLQDEKIERLENELAAFASTQDEGGGG